MKTPSLQKLLSIVAALSALTFGAAEDNNDPDTLVMGIISTESSSQLRKGFDPFIEELSRKLDKPIKAYFATDYAGVIEAMRFNKVHIAWMGNKSAMEAVDRAGAEVFAQTTNADGSIGYHSILLVHRDSPLQSPEQIEEQAAKLVFGNGDPNSTSGYLIPYYYLWSPRGIDPQRSFKHTRNANHEVNCLAVAMEQVDFATANDEALSRFAVSRPKLHQRLRVIWKSPTIPNDPIVWRRDLSPELKAKLKGAFLSFGRIGPNRDAEVKLLDGIQDGWGPFLDSSNAQLVPIREIAIAKEMQSVLSDRYIPENKKASLIAMLEKRKAELSNVSDSLKRLTDGFPVSKN